MDMRLVEGRRVSRGVGGGGGENDCGGGGGVEIGVELLPIETVDGDLGRLDSMEGETLTRCYKSVL